MATRKFSVSVVVEIDGETLVQECLRDVEELVVEALQLFEDTEEVKIFESVFNANAEELTE